MKYAKHIKILKRARKTLPRKVEQTLRAEHNICAHVDEALHHFCDDLDFGEEHDEWCDAQHQIANLIRELLGGCDFLEEWLRDRGLVPAEVVHKVWDLSASTIDPEVFKKLQRTRIAWIDWMIAHYRAQAA